MSGQKTVTPNADSLVASIKAAKTRGLPPVDKWDPAFCGDLDMQIKRDGTWFYQGTPIGRPGLVKLFASILKREGTFHDRAERLGAETDSDYVKQIVDFILGESDRSFLTPK